jgi:hypothetical protein
MVNLSAKLAAALGIGLALLVIEYAYFKIFAESYFPDRYETAFGVVVTTTILAVLTTLLVITTHFGSYQRFERNALAPKLARTLTGVLVVLGLEYAYFVALHLWNVPVIYEPYRVFALTFIVGFLIVLFVGLRHGFKRRSSSTN